MATATASRYLRDQIIEPVASGASDNNRTLWEAGLYSRIYIGPEFLGSWTTYEFTENSGSDNEDQGGNDWLEAKPGKRVWEWSFTRKKVRGKTLRDKIYQIYTGAHLRDIDFRVLPFDMSFQQYYQSASGNTTYQNEVDTLFDCYAQRYTISQPDTKGFREERVSGWARGSDRNGSHGSEKGASLNQFKQLAGLHSTGTSDPSYAFGNLGGQ